MHQMERTEEKESKFPRPFHSGWMYPFEGGQNFHILVDECGFRAVEETGNKSNAPNPEDSDYWPETVVWSGAAETLDQLLRQLAEANHLDLHELLAMLDDYLGLEITSYLAEEAEAIKTKDGLRELWVKRPDLQGDTEIYRVPSPAMHDSLQRRWLEYDFSPADLGSACDGLVLYLEESGWRAELLSDAADPPEDWDFEQWSGETLDDLITTQSSLSGQTVLDRWDITRNELASLLIADDPRWRPFIESKEINSESPKDWTDPK